MGACILMLRTALASTQKAQNPWKTMQILAKRAADGIQTGVRNASESGQGIL
jgi:hypothetical protein